MFTMKRNQVVVTALAVMIGAAGYLNFQESQTGVQTALELSEEGDMVAVLTDYETLPDDVFDVAEVGSEVGADAATVAEYTTFDPITAEPQTTLASTTTGDGTAIFVNGTSVTDGIAFFAEAKLDREQARAKQKEILNDMLDNANVSQEQKDTCGNNLIALQERIEKETAAEALIESKGFTEAYVRIDDNTVDVVVDKAELTPVELAQIEDVVKRKTGYSADQIRINTLKQ